MINRKKIFSGIAVDYIASIVAVVIGFIVVPYYFDYITKAEFGVWLLVSGVVAFFSMADLGADQYLTTVTSNDDKFYSDSYSDYVSFILVIKIEETFDLPIKHTMNYQQPTIKVPLKYYSE